MADRMNWKRAKKIGRTSNVLDEQDRMKSDYTARWLAAAELKEAAAKKHRRKPRRQY